MSWTRMAMVVGSVLASGFCMVPSIISWLASLKRGKYGEIAASMASIWPLRLNSSMPDHGSYPS